MRQCRWAYDMTNARQVYLHMGREGIPFMMERVPFLFAREIRGVIGGGQVGVPPLARGP
jgi:hypothetical protein